VPCPLRASKTGLAAHLSDRDEALPHKQPAHRQNCRSVQMLCPSTASITAIGSVTCNGTCRCTQLVVRVPHRKQANFCREAREALGEVVDRLAVVEAVPVDVLCLEHPLVVKKVRLAVLVLVPARI
jgi:hypothetical protein